MHIFHSWHTVMTHDEVIKICRICGKEERRPWHQIQGWSRPPKVPPLKIQTTPLKPRSGLPPKNESEDNKPIRDDGLTREEGVIMDALIKAWNAFTKLERQHPDEIRDFADGIHKCQDLLAVRIARREYPKGWPIK